MQREEGWRAPGSGYGFPHGKHRKEFRRKRAEERKQIVEGADIYEEWKHTKDEPLKGK